LSVVVRAFCYSQRDASNSRESVAMPRKAGGPFVPRKVRVKKIVVADPSLTVAEFCDAESIGRSTYHKLRKEGRGPRELRIGPAIRITHQARIEWRKKMQKESEAA
jgi:hypothetical protein